MTNGDEHDSDQPTASSPAAGAQMLLRERETPEGVLVSVCDVHCLGETFEEGELSIDVTEDFYGGEEASRADSETIVESLRRATTANLVGETSVRVAIEANIVNPDRVLRIDGTPHAQVLRMR